MFVVLNNPFKRKSTMEKKLAKAKLAMEKNQPCKNTQITPRNKNKYMNEGPRKSLL